MARKITRFTDEVKQFILDKMASGLDTADICRKWPDKVPLADSIYRKAIDDPEFGAKYDQAYTILLMHRLDALHKIAITPARDLSPQLSEYKEAADLKREMMLEAQFVLGKMAPILSKRFNKVDKVELNATVDVRPIQIVSWATPVEHEVKGQLLESLKLPLTSDLDPSE